MIIVVIHGSYLNHENIPKFVVTKQKFLREVYRHFRKLSIISQSQTKISLKRF